MIHESAADGYAVKSATYAQVRPSYHPMVLGRLVSALRAGATIDLGAGTGISTAALVERGIDVTAVEPVAAMRERLSESLPDVTVLDGKADSIPVADSSVANVLVAQAFHWFDHGPALDELARVLESDGLLITLWNVRDETVAWQQEWTRIIDRFQGDTPRYRTMIWRTAIEQDRRFTLIDEVRVPNPQPSSADHVVGRALSTSFIAALGRRIRPRSKRNFAKWSLTWVRRSTSPTTPKFRSGRTRADAESRISRSAAADLNLRQRARRPGHRERRHPAAAEEPRG